MSQAIAAATAEAVQEQARVELAQHRPALPAPRPVPGMEGRKLPRPPSWWTGDEQATRQSLIAVQQLKQRR